MPLYSFKCTHCGKKIEVIQKINDSNPPCPECQSQTQKIMGVSNFQLIGKGWAKDGYSG